MTSKSQKLKVGIFALVAAALVGVVLAVFAGVRIWEERATYRIVFDGSVYGLEPGASVYLNGMKIGAVAGLAPSAENLGDVVATIEVDADAPVRADTQAMLQFAGITGLKIIDLRGGTYAAAPLPEGGTIRAGETTIDKLSAQAVALADQSRELMDKANTIVANLASVTDPAKFERMQEIVDNLATTTADMKGLVAESRTALRGTLTSVGAAATSAKTALDRTTVMLDDQVGVLLANANKLVGEMSGLIANNAGSVRSAVFDLRQASRSFKELAREVRQRPSRLLFSDAQAERKMP
jgi:phospholipid/cholesterol/gamma-HCH transport system substrate-binding protein